MKRRAIRPVLLVLLVCLPGPAGRAVASEPATAGFSTFGSGDDVAAARRVFEENLDAIRRRDRDAYLATYLNAESLARTGPEGPPFE